MSELLSEKCCIAPDWSLTMPLALKKRVMTNFEALGAKLDESHDLFVD